MKVPAGLVPSGDPENPLHARSWPPAAPQSLPFLGLWQHQSSLYRRVRMAFSSVRPSFSVSYKDT